MLRRAGRGHDPAGVDATAEGECVVMCPACPHPGINMPEGWEKVPEDKQWVWSEDMERMIRPDTPLL